MNWFQRQIAGIMKWGEPRNYRGDYTQHNTMATEMDTTSIHIHKANNGYVIELYGEAKTQSIIGSPERFRTLWVVGADDSLTDSVVRALVAEKLK